MKKKNLFSRMLLLFALIVGVGSAWAQTTVTWPGTTALPGTATAVQGDPNITIMTSSTNTYTNPIRIYANTTITIKALNNAKIQSVTYEAYSTGNYVTYAQNATVTPKVTPTVSEKKVTWSFTGDVTEFTFMPSSQTRANSISITYISSGSQTAAETSVTIDASGITNTDVYSGTTAGTLSATVKAGETIIEGATVTWSGNNNDVATINASTGAVTLVAAGTVTFTAYYAGVSGTYQASTNTYEMTVTDSTPYVQPTEIEIIPNYTFWGQTGQFSGDTYDDLSGEQDNVSLSWTRGNGSTYANLNAMRFYKDNTLTFTAPSGYEIKSIVLVVSGTYDDLSFDPQGFNSETKTWTGSSETVSMSRPSDASSYATINKFTITIGLPSTDPSITAEDVNLAANATSGVIEYSITNPVSGTTLTAAEKIDVDWISNVAVAVGETKVTFTTTANTIEQERSAIITLTYGSLTKDVTVTQAAYEPPFVGAEYTLATSITPGKHYIIVGKYTDNDNNIDYYYAMGEQKTNNRDAVVVEENNGNLTTTEYVTEFVIYGPDASGNYTIYENNAGYLYAASSGSNYLKTESTLDANGKWEITIAADPDAEASIIAQGSNTRNIMRFNYNSGSPLFACYGSASQSDVYLYEKVNETAPTSESVTVSNLNYATYSSEFALNFRNKGITVYKAKANGTSVSLTPVSDGIVPAYTGVVLYADGGASADVPVATTASNITWDDNEMVANVKRAKVYLKEGDKTNYILSNEDNVVGFYKAAANGAYLPAHRAYLSTSTVPTGNAPFLGFDGEGTTGIQSITSALSQGEGVYYDLSGRRVAEPTKGIYILNGKKVVVK